jgi:hypothetical protein
MIVLVGMFGVWGIPERSSALKRLLKKYSPDLVFLSETKLSGLRQLKLEIILGIMRFFGWIVLVVVGV